VRLVEATAFHIRIPLRKPVRHASHERGSTDNILVRCVLDDNTEGFGEGVPRDYVTGETIDTALDLLSRSDLKGQWEEPDTFARAVELAERLRLPEVPGDDRRCQGNAARCAMEMAVLDAYARRFGEPLSAVTRVAAPELFRPRRWVRYSAVLTSMKTPWKLRLTGLMLWAYGIRQVKMKVGLAGQDDANRLRLLRTRLGRRIDVRVDANEAWARDQALGRIRELEPFGISSVEQPVPHPDADVLAEVRRQTKVPIMLDESLCGMVDAERAAASGICDLFNLRLSKCGGFLPTLRLAQFTRAHGLGYQLGCQVGETAVLSAAGRHFASSVADIRYLEGSYDRYLVREALAKENLTFRWGGMAPALRGPGLGITIDPRALERVTVRKISLL
jgi:L-alanine-DL-glutamate epimerase-like enolase superfamily enzyme